MLSLAADVLVLLHAVDWWHLFLFLLFGLYVGPQARDGVLIKQDLVKAGLIEKFLIRFPAISSCAKCLSIDRLFTTHIIYKLPSTALIILLITDIQTLEDN